MTDNTENTDEVKPTRDQTHSAIDNAVATHVANIGLEGILASWTLAGNIVFFDEDGNEAETFYQTASNGISRWQNIGLLTDALENAKSTGMRELLLGMLDGIEDDEEGEV